MMTGFLLVGFAVMALLAARAFLLPYLVWGPQAFDDFARRNDQKLAVGVLASAAIALACLPVAASVLISGEGQMQVFAETILGVPGRFWS